MVRPPFFFDRLQLSAPVNDLRLSRTTTKKLVKALRACYFFFFARALERFRHRTCAFYYSHAIVI